MPNNEVVAIYCRLSVEDKGAELDESQSIINQRLMLTDYAKHQGWRVFDIYIDNDYSGMDNNRPQFNKMIAHAEAGLFNIILCKTQSRFTRDMEIVEKYIHGDFLNWGIRFVSIVDNVDTDIKGNKKTRQINGLINEWYCEDLSENIRAVFKRKMEEGQFLGSFAPYGYEKDPLEHHKLCIDADAAKVVNEIFCLYLKGYGYNSIAKILSQNNIPSPCTYKANKGSAFSNPNFNINNKRSGLWSPNTIRKILNDRVYLGCLVQGKQRKVSLKSKKVTPVLEENWIVVENTHEPIIDHNTFLKVQDLISQKRKIYNK